MLFLSGHCLILWPWLWWIRSSDCVHLFLWFLSNSLNCTHIPHVSIFFHSDLMQPFDFIGVSKDLFNKIIWRCPYSICRIDRFLCLRKISRELSFRANTVTPCERLTKLSYFLYNSIFFKLVKFYLFFVRWESLWVLGHHAAHYILVLSLKLMLSTQSYCNLACFFTFFQIPCW